MSKSPEESAQQGANILTEWMHFAESLSEYAASYEARGGTNWYNSFKYEAAEGGELTESQLAYNEKIDKWAQIALEVVTHTNELNEWLNSARRQRIALIRTDYN